MPSHKLWHRVLAEEESGERRDRKLREVWVGLPAGVYSPSMDIAELHAGVPIPQFLAGTPLGDRLRDRMVFSDWKEPNWNKLNAYWQNKRGHGFTAEAMLKIQNQLGIKRSTIGDQRQCENCSTYLSRTETLKCQGCLTARYCSRQCQMANWPTHRQHCELPLPKLATHLGLVLPKMSCTDAYEDWYRNNFHGTREDGERYVGLSTPDLKNFIKTFGEASYKRCLLRLAVDGYPDLTTMVSHHYRVNEDYTEIATWDAEQVNHVVCGENEEILIINDGLTTLKPRAS